MSDWLDTNGLDLARLLVQIGILAAVVLYSRKLLKTLRASQEQMGALLRLSVSEGTQERNASIAEPAVAPPGFTAPAPAEVQPAFRAHAPEPALNSRVAESALVPEREQSLGGRVVAERDAGSDPEGIPSTLPSLTPWVAAPAKTNGDSEHVESLAARMADSRRNLGRWLQESPKRTGVNPFRRMIRWLQAPAGH